jgi:hypothetical protein
MQSCYPCPFRLDNLVPRSAPSGDDGPNVELSLTPSLGEEFAGTHLFSVICPPLSARSMRVSRSADHSEGDRTSDRAGAAQE